jgi:NAD+ synthase (glutamine-hydrolysing)
MGRHWSYRAKHSGQNPGTILMAFSNKFNSLVLSTGNKSELAVGYCTLYGDMSGGLAVISDVPKTVVYELSEYVNRHKEIIPVNIIKKAPSAELKPNQIDQDDLPPYEILDPILKAYIEHASGVDDLVEMGFDRSIVEDVVQRVFRNEYKRHQAAPGLRVTSKAFGYGRRYPVAQRFRSKKY